MQPDTVSVGDDRRPIARLQGIQKSYPGVKALKGIDFDIFGGEIHCLVGENGAGKSTLMRVLTGATQPDTGVIEIDGTPTILDPVSRLAYGIGIVHQELDLIPAMSVAENIFLGHETAFAGRTDRPQGTQRTYDPASRQFRSRRFTGYPGQDIGAG